MNLREVSLYMDIAKRVSQQSYATRLKVGSVFVSVDGIISIGYNGTPAGWDNCCEQKIYLLPDVTLTGNEYFDAVANRYYVLETKQEVLHSERNLFGKCLQAGLSTKGGSLFMTHSPCLECAKEIYHAKVANVVYGEVYRSCVGIDFLKKANVNISHYIGEVNEICHCKGSDE
jgi:dCMP deaminase